MNELVKTMTAEGAGRKGRPRHGGATVPTYDDRLATLITDPTHNARDSRTSQKGKKGGNVTATAYTWCRQAQVFTISVRTRSRDMINDQCRLADLITDHG